MITRHFTEIALRPPRRQPVINTKPSLQRPINEFLSDNRFSNRLEQPSLVKGTFIVN